MRGGIREVVRKRPVILDRPSLCIFHQPQLQDSCADIPRTTLRLDRPEASNEIMFEVLQSTDLMKDFELAIAGSSVK